MARYDSSLYSEKWMEGVREDAMKRLDNPRRFQSDIVPTMWDSADLALEPEPGQAPAPIMFTPGFVVTIKLGKRTLVYHTDNKESFRLASDTIPED